MIYLLERATNELALITTLIANWERGRIASDGFSMFHKMSDQAL